MIEEVLERTPRGGDERAVQTGMGGCEDCQGGDGGEGGWEGEVAGRRGWVVGWTVWVGWAGFDGGLGLGVGLGLGGRECWRGHDGRVGRDEDGTRSDFFGVENMSWFVFKNHGVVTDCEVPGG